VIECDPTTATWLLTTPRTAYALRLGEDVRHVHWGPLVGLGDAAAMPASAAEELPGEGGERFGPPSLSVEFADGTRAVEWSTPSAAAEDGHLAVRLADRHYPLELELHYRVRPDSDVLERWTVLRNTGAEPVAVGRLDAANWALPSRTGWCLSTVAGEWAAEFRLRRSEAAWGETVFTSRRGTSRHQNNPWLSVDAGATEERGEVWSVALAWSGTYRIAVARTLADRLTVAAGAGHDLVLTKLRPGEEWRTPVCCGLYTVDGFGGASRAWHDHIRRHVLPAADEPRPVLYNGWEGTWFDVNEVNQREVAAIAAELGAEPFVMDDGWFGRRLDDRAGLGDWWPNPDRFPDGLGPLVADVRRLGMRFGLWVEPEMVNPDSDLYRAHPTGYCTCRNAAAPRFATSWCSTSPGPTWSSGRTPGWTGSSASTASTSSSGT